jgi:hypothetical protein
MGRSLCTEVRLPPDPALDTHQFMLVGTLWNQSEQYLSWVYEDGSYCGATEEGR